MLVFCVISKKKFLLIRPCLPYSYSLNTLKKNLNEILPQNIKYIKLSKRYITNIQYII